MKKWLIALAVGVACCVLLMSVLGTALLLKFGSDSQTVNDSDLIAKRPVIADSDNAFILIQKATQAFYRPASPNSTPARNFLYGKDYDKEALKTFFKRNETVFNMLRMALKKPAFQEPEITSINGSMPYLSSIRFMALGLAAKSRWERSHNHITQAMDDSLVIVGVGDRFAENPECLISYLVGVATLEIGLNEVESLVKDPRIPTAEQEKARVMLNELTLNTQGIKRAFKKEYQFASKICDDIATGKIADYTEVDAKIARMPKFYIFQPKKTKQLMADYYRSLINQADVCAAEYAPSSFPDDFKSWEDHKLTTAVKPNVVGKILLGLLLPAVDRAHMRHCAMEADISGVKLMTALALFERQKGHLPQTLDALVPDLIPAVPRDPFDGKPFRYIPEKRRVYSVGRNLTDDGGSTDWNKQSYHSGVTQHPRGREDMNDAVFTF